MFLGMHNIGAHFSLWRRHTHAGRERDGIVLRIINVCKLYTAVEPHLTPEGTASKHLLYLFCIEE